MTTHAILDPAPSAPAHPIEETYGEGFAHVYNEEWQHAVLGMCPGLETFTRVHPVAGRIRRVLDVCCGTGQLARYFADLGYEVVGVDQSPSMLRHAADNAGDHLTTGRISLHQQEVSRLDAGAGFGAAFATCDSMNHLMDFDALAEAFRRIRAALAVGGVFVFDMHTESGLSQLNNAQIRETEDLFFAARTLFDPETAALVARVSGCYFDGSGWRRFIHTLRERAFATDRILAALRTAGFGRATVAQSLRRLDTPVAEPDRLPRVVFVADEAGKEL